jgi:phosphohistidine swiveling domain-containing protein
MERWITDTATSARFPYYTRANADEVGPDPFSPLGWSLVWQQGCIPGVARGFVEFGVVAWEEYDLDPPQVFGNWGGYFYNPLSLSRLMGCRMPGATPEAIDQAYFGDHPGVPPYEPHPDDENEAATAKLGETMAWVMSTDSYALQERAAATARRAVASRPDLSGLTDAALVEYARSMAPLVAEVWLPYCVVCLGASLGPGAVQAICGALGRPEDAVKLLAAVGGVESAGASLAMWDLGRLVTGSAELTSLFDDGVDGLLERLDTSSADGAAFQRGWDELMQAHGHRGPNEWDMRPHSWTTKPQLALGMIDRLRHQTDDRSPHVAAERAAAERERLSAELLAMLDGDPETKATFGAALTSAGRWLGWRELGKNACIRLIHEAKLAMYELGDRMVERGELRDVQDVFLLLDSELDDFLADPGKFADTMVERDAAFRSLHELEPPYIVGGSRPAPPISTWPPRNGGGHTMASAGEVLQGGPGAPGVVTGRARIVLDPADAPDLEPGDILVAPTTDPSWVPLFLSVGGVVTNVGAVGSHAAIVSRELGVPCAVSVVHATDRIPEGATITIDGSTGTVTVVSV